MEEDETPSAFFWDLRIKKFQKHFTTSVWDAIVDSLSSLPDFLIVHEQFYSALFPEDDIQDLLISYISRSLSEEHLELCEGFVTLEELTDALKLWTEIRLLASMVWLQNFIRLFGRISALC